MVFIETSVFTQVIKGLVTDDEYRALQWVLVRNPKKGALIPGAGGLRKVRWASRQKRKGTRGGIRVIYYIQSAENLYMLFAYGKSDQQDLTRGQLKILQGYVRKGVL